MINHLKMKENLLGLNNMKESERNKRLMLLINKLIGEKDIESIELIETLIKNDTESMKKSFSLFNESINNIK